ncbi:MAG: alpha/beta fold hydrolase [Saprospiraceae bacterium]|nr:alpha/beta fold hydrolase [Saprospiraceae bacterium]
MGNKAQEICSAAQPSVKTAMLSTMQTVDFPWLDTNEYPFAQHWFFVAGHKLHYIDEGQSDDVLFFVHGTPSWSFDFRHLIKTLSPRYRCIALDHMGFGLSDKPIVYDYATPNHAATLQHLINHLNLRNITLVVHDFGGPIGFHYALHFPENIRRIVLMNTWLWDASNDPVYQKTRKFLKSPLLPFLYKYLNFSPRVLLPQSYADRKNLSHAVHRQYIRPFSRIRERSGPLAFANSLLNDQPWFGSMWERIGALREKPVLLLWGLKDPFLSKDDLEKWKGAFSTARVVELENAGHFPQDEAREDVVLAMSHFLKAYPVLP